MARKRKGLSDKVRTAKTKRSNSTNLNKIYKNPFEVKTNKQKHTILGRKTKHDSGMPGISRSKANKKRVDTLLREYQQRNKANIIQDERLGVNNEQITLEEKMLQRFALERKKKHDKLAQFNLNDDDEELTHLGQSLSTVEKFDDYVESDDDDANGTISREYVEHAHFGGGIFKKKVDSENEEQDQHKTRKDVIEEIIAKSKAAKFEKQTAKDESEELRGKLDDAWADFQDLLRPSIRTPFDKEMAKENSKPDDYDRVVKQMLFDRKAAPAERKKTKEEIEAEKKAELQKQEEDRLSRMQIDSDDKRKHQSADALEDEFARKDDDDEAGILSYPLYDGADMENEDEDVDASNSEGRDTPDTEERESEAADQGIVDDGASLDADEEEEESDSYSDIDSGNEDGADLLSWEGNAEEEKEEEKQEETPDAPSKFPSSYAEFSALVTKADDEENAAAAMVTERLRKNYAPALRKGNKAKMIELFAYVWEHCCKMASTSHTRLEVISSLTSHLHDLCSMNIESCSQCIIERLKRSHHSCFSSGKAKKKQWPSLEIIIQFKLIKLLYSTSDFSHRVATRALTFMCNVITVCRITSQRDIARGLFLCTIMYEYVCFSKRLIPECLNFLVSVLSMSIPIKKQQKFGLPEVAVPRLNKTNCNLLVTKKRKELNDEKINLIELLREESDQDTDLIKSQLVITALRLGRKFASLYSALPAYDELFLPLKRICKLNGGKNIKHSPNVVEHLKILLQEIEENCNKPRKYLSVGPTKPKPLRMFDPKIENPGEPFDRRSRTRNQSAAKRERDRLIHKRRREMKGAMREIRKDSKFISRQRQKEQEQLDEERAAKVKRLYGLLSNQEGEVKNIERRKYKLEL